MIFLCAKSQANRASEIICDFAIFILTKSLVGPLSVMLTVSICKQRFTATVISSAIRISNEIKKISLFQYRSVNSFVTVRELYGCFQE